jgi:hypothetical protein
MQKIGGGHWTVWGKSIQFLQKKAMCCQNLLKMLKTVSPRIDRIPAATTPKGHEVAKTLYNTPEVATTKG